jgi:hypothetical protein
MSTLKWRNSTPGAAARRGARIGSIDGGKGDMSQVARLVELRSPEYVCICSRCLCSCSVLNPRRGLREAYKAVLSPETDADVGETRAG